MTTSGIDVKITLDIPGAMRFAGDKIDEWLRPAGELVLEKAKENVSPGRGPGPHPHKEYPGWPDWADTGNLRDSLTMYGPFALTSTVHAVEIGGDGSVDYGKHLEAGWISEAGNFWRYPYLLPALTEQWGRMMRLFRTVGAAGTPGSYVGYGGKSVVPGGIIKPTSGGEF